MKKITFIAFLAVLLSCRKDDIPGPSEGQPQNKENIITVKQAQDWLQEQSSTTITSKYPIRWKEAKSVPTANGNRIVIRIPGQPTFQNTKLGYRLLSFQRDLGTKNIEGSILEIIPDGVYWQGKRKVGPADFTGRILEYDLSYRLVKGKLYASGKQVGECRQATASEKTAYLENPDQLRPLGSLEQNSSTGSSGKISRAMAIETCAWYQTTYIDSEGVFTVYSERICSYSFYDDGGGGGGGYMDPGIGGGGSGGGGGGSQPSNPGPPAPSELPGETQPSVDPKKMMECFSSITTPNAAYQIRVFVQEPLPGTFFNIGPNAFGHVAIQLTKAGDGQVITQTVGFYPTGTGLDKLISTSRMIDNGGLEYTMSASYWTNAQDFQKIVNYVSSPPRNYHYTDFNCAAFVYQAGRAGNIPIPDPTTQIGFAGPGGAGTAMTPQGMAQALSQQKANNPSADISRASGRVPASKGECK